MLVRTYNEYHLGDQLHHLHYLRKVCQLNPDVEATHYCKEEYHSQLLPLLEGVPIVLLDLPAKPVDAINAWIGANDYFYRSPLRHDWVAFHLDWFSYFSNQLNVMNPMQSPQAFLFDYPALERGKYPFFDYLIVNSIPMSNQLPSFNHQYFVQRTFQLIKDGHRVITTYPTDYAACTQQLGMTVTDIGCLAKNVDHIEGVDTGPMWTTYNVYAQTPTRKVYSNAHDINLLSTVTHKHLPTM